MILASKHPSFSKIIREYSSNSLFLEVSFLLRNGAYELSYSFHKPSRSLSYVATKKEGVEAAIPLICLSLNYSGALTSPLNPSSAALYTYLVSSESELAENDPFLLESIYSLTKKELALFSSLDEKYVEGIQKDKEKLRNSLILANEEVQFSSPSSLLTLDFRISSISADSIFFFIDISSNSTSLIFDKKTSILQNVLSDHLLILKDGTRVSLDPSSFAGNGFEVLFFLASKMIPQAFPSDLPSLVGLKIEDFASFLLLLKDQGLSYSNIKYIKNPNIIETKAILEEGNLISFSPSPSNISKKDLTYRKGADVVSLNSISKTIDTYHFLNSKAAIFFMFVLEKGEQSLVLIEDLLTNNAECFELSEGLGESFKIALHLDMVGKENLSFKTKYSYRGKEWITPSESDPFYINVKRSNYLSLLSSLGGLEDGILADQEKVFTFLSSDLSSLQSQAEIYLSQSVSGIKVSSLGKIDVKATSGIDWLSLNISCLDFDEEELKEILKAHKKKKKFIKLEGRFIKIDSPELNELENLEERIGLGDEVLFGKEVPLYMGFKIGETSIKKLSIQGSQDIQKAILDVASFKTKEIELSSKFTKVLKPYQSDGIRWMMSLYEHHLGGVLGDDMGLGKSLESIAFISLLKEAKPILIVCPKSLVYNWLHEFSLWDKDMRVYPISGSRSERISVISSIKNNEKVVYVTSYDSLRNDVSCYDGLFFSLLFLDETQFIKNSNAKKSAASKRLRATSRFGLTGTPLENGVMDLWSVFDFLLPGYLGRADSFRNKYQKDEADLTSLKEKLLPFILRRKKVDVLKELPKKNVSLFMIEMDEKSKKLYAACLLEARDKLSEGGAFSVLPTLTKLREIAVDPSSFFEGKFETSSKLTFALESIATSIKEGHRILVFSSFKRVLDHLGALLIDEGIPSFSITGETSSKDRIRICDDFNHFSEEKVVLVSLKAGGTGLNLQGADIVIHLDPWWNIASEEQATDRAYRIGQTRNVNVYKLIAHDSIEEKVVSLQKKKKKLYDALISDSDKPLTSLTKEDIAFLLS